MRLCACCDTNNTILICTINLDFVSDIKLNNVITILKCEKCNFLFSDSNNTQIDYNSYYQTFNNYNKYITYSDKDIRCSEYLKQNLKNYKIKKILNYGSGNGNLTKLLSDNFIVDEFDIGMNKNTKQYDCLILSHVLEHIYDLNDFIKIIKSHIFPNGVLYIEVPNIDLYDQMTDISPLQEINIEHINFFSKSSLNRLLSKFNFVPLSLTDDYFKIKDNNYYVIRGIFQLYEGSDSFKKYIENGFSTINKYNFKCLSKYKNIYVYGSGQLLFKIFNKINNEVTITNIIDDNLCYTNKNINGIDIIDFHKYTEIVKSTDVILLTSLIYDTIIKEKIQKLDSSLTVLSLSDLL